MSEEEKHTKETKETSDSSIYYILGGVVLVAAIAGFFLLKPKDATMTPAANQQEVQAPPAVPPTPAPITKFACEKIYYNPVVGFPKYFLSAEGVDLKTTGTVTCEFTESVKNKVVGTQTVSAQIVANDVRGGGTFRCQSDAVELAKGIATDVEVKVTGEANETGTCTQTFIFP